MAKVNPGARYAQYTHLGEELRFVKDNQWRTTYYSVLVDAVVVGAFQLQIVMGSWHKLLQWVAGVVLGLLALLFSWIQWGNLQSLKTDRCTMDELHAALGLKLIEVETEKRYKRDRRYTLAFIAVIMAAAFAAIVIVAKDSRSS